ncbi:MAG TPA: response regulator [Pyrinomonadaceae bacterium]|jgi:PAS domain S-box-containing protein
MPKAKHSPFLCYGLPVLAVMLATAVKLLLGAAFKEDTPFLLFFGAVMLSANYGGLGPGLLAVALSVAVNDYLFFTPYTFVNTSAQASQLMLFTLEGALISLICARRRRAETWLRTAQDELEARVARRTAELERVNASLLEEMNERRRIEQVQHESDNLLHAIIEGTTDAVYVKDLDGRYLMINRAGARLLGREVADVIGKKDSELFSPEAARLIIAADRRVIASGRTQTFEEVGTAGGQTRTYLSTKGPYRDTQENVIGLIGISRDIRDRKLIEEELAESRDAALEASRLKSEFLANMSHEIRTPMNGIVGMTGLLLNTKLTRQQREFATDIQTSADALLTILNDILDFSKIEAGKLKLEEVDFDLHALVESVAEFAGRQARAKGIEMASLIYGDVPAHLRGDPGRLRQVLINLLSNAVKFTEAGEVVLRVTKSGEKDGHAVLRFTVTDTGIGIDEACQRRLFRPFTQADGSAARRYGGTGLGLAISKQIVEYMHGEMGVESTPRQGSTFWFTARLAKQPGAGAQAPGAVQTLRGVRLLIVDDNETNRKILQYQTEAWGMSNESAASGAEALAMLRHSAAAGEPFDLAVLDMQMPGMDGLTLARMIKSDPDLAATRLVMISSTDDPDDVERLKEVGVVACLTKPVRQSQLFNHLLSAIAGEAVTQEVQTHGAAGGSPAPDVRPPRYAAPRKGGRILVAEDHLVNQKVLLHQLSELGYEADAVANGWQVLDALHKNSYDLVLMDCQMPGLDGYETTAEIRRREGDMHHTPVVAVTAHAFESDRQKCLATGMDDYIAKPVNPQTLKTIIERWLKPTTPAESPAPPSADAAARLEAAIAPSVSALFRAARREGAPDPVRELLHLYLRETQPMLDQLRADIARGDAGAIQRTAHGIKGTSAALGIERMAALSGELEQNGRDGVSAGADSIMAGLAEEFERIRRLLNEG